MGSQQLPRATLFLLGVLGEYPRWGVCQGTWAQGGGRKCQFFPWSISGAALSPLWSITEGCGHQDPCLRRPLLLCSRPHLSHPSAPTLFLSCPAGGLPVPF